MCDDIMAKSWKLLALLNFAFVAADVQVYRDPYLADPLILLADFYDEEANFGMDIPKRGVTTGVVVAEPDHACGPQGILPPPNVPNPPSHWAVLIRRYNCSFEEKVLNAQNAFYDVAIVHNVDSNKLEIMNASHPELIHIMAIFISANAGKEIKTKYLYERGFVVRIEPNSGGDILGKILIPFIFVISSCFILMVGFMVVKCIKDHRRNRRRRMPYSTLNRIPTTRFRKNDPYETCAICLDDFIEGEKLRVLPCSHAYHCKCIDPWLTRNRRVCPMCKRKVFAADERVESDGSSSEDDDHTPLLRGRNANANTTYSATRRLQLLRAEHMRQVLDALERQGLDVGQRGSQERNSESSDTSSPSSFSTYSDSRDDTLEQQQAHQRESQRADNEEADNPHHEDHRRDHPSSEPSRDSAEGSRSRLLRVTLEHSGQQLDRELERHSPQPLENHTASTSDHHHEVSSDNQRTVALDDPTHDSHHEVTDHSTHDSPHEVTFNDDTPHDSHSHEC